MQALRQYYTVQGNTVLLRLPDNFDAKHIEVIILPREEHESSPSVASEQTQETFSLPWQQRRSSPPPPLPVWTEEERRNFLTLLQNGPTLTEEEISEWEKEIALMRSIPSLGWDNL